MIFPLQLQNPKSTFRRALNMTRSTLMTKFHSTVILTFPLDGSTCGSKTMMNLLKLQANIRSTLFGRETRETISAKLKEEAPWCSSQNPSSSMFMVCEFVCVPLLYFIYVSNESYCIKLLIIVHFQSVPRLMPTCWLDGPRFFPQIACCCNVRWKVS